LLFQPQFYLQLLKQAVAARWAATTSFSGPERCCSQPASQLAGIGLLRTVQPTDPLPEVTHNSKSLGLSAHIFRKMSLFS